MARYKHYHAANGYGYVKKATSMPLGTGSYVHQALAGVLEQAKKLGGYPAKDLVYKEIKTQVAAYRSLIRARGFDRIEDDAEVEWTAKEQAALIEGLVWGYYKAILPTLVKEFEILDIEREEEPLELGQGVYLMVRADFVARRKADREVGIHDFKTAAWTSEADLEEYKHSVQTALTTEAVEARMGERVGHYYIHQLVKGQRKQEYNGQSGEYDGPKRQQSALVYLYERPANPPLQEPDYQPKWKYKGQDGRSHLLGKAYHKKPIWETGLTSEQWVDRLPNSFLWELFPMLGPFKKQEWMLPGLKREMVAEELRWVNRLHQLAEDESNINELIPRSLACHKFGIPCSFIKECFGEEKDPLGSGKFILRRPHHEPEIEQMLERGLEVPPPEIGDEDAA